MRKLEGLREKERNENHSTKKADLTGINTLISKHFEVIDTEGGAEWRHPKGGMRAGASLCACRFLPRQTRLFYPFLSRQQRVTVFDQSCTERCSSCMFSPQPAHQSPSFDLAVALHRFQFSGAGFFFHCFLYSWRRLEFRVRSGEILQFCGLNPLVARGLCDRSEDPLLQINARSCRHTTRFGLLDFCRPLDGHPQTLQCPRLQLKTYQ